MLFSLKMFETTFSLVLLLLPVNLGAVDFAPAKSHSVGTNPGGIAVGDFNGDGKPDIAVANTGSNTVSILLGNGDGTFQAAMNFVAGNSPSTIAVGDFNGNGRLDLALLQPSANGLPGSVSILLGNGDGTFQSPRVQSVGLNALQMAVADFNLDKKPDLMVTGSSSVAIYLGNGDGTFQPAKQTALSSIAGRFAIGDFNGDSKPDLAVVTTGGIQILNGNGDGTFSMSGKITVTFTRIFPPFYLEYDDAVAADLNHDGKVDLLVSSHVIKPCGPIPPCSETFTKISAFLGNGDGTFQGETTVVGGFASLNFGGSKVDRPFIGDFNGDGMLDVAYQVTLEPSRSTFFQIRLGKGDGTFSVPVADVANSIVGTPVPQDLNADKLTDLIAFGAANDIDVLLNTSPLSGADMAVLNSGALPDPVSVGTDLTFTADVLNLGPHAASGVTLTDTLPNNVNFVSATATAGSCVHSNGTVSCNIGSLASAFNSVVSIVVTPAAAGAVTNTMNVTASEPDPVSANNTATQISYAVQVYTLTVTKTGNGSGTVTSNPGASGAVNCGSACSAIYLSGTTVSVNASPDANSVFAGWSGACTGTGPCTLTMNADQSVTARFMPGVKLNVAVAGSGSGSVTSKDGGINCTSSVGNCSSLYLPGASVSLTAAPASTSSFGGWSGACTGTDPNVCPVTMNSVQSVTATFNPVPDFTLAPAVTTFTMQTGTQVTDALTIIGQNGFTGPIRLTCVPAGPAPLPTCNVSPSPVTLGANPGSATLTITAPASLRAFIPSVSEGSTTAYAVVLPFPALLIGGISLASKNFNKRRRSLWLLGASLVVLLAVLVGCGGGSTPPPTSQNYTITVSAACGSLTHSTTVNVVVQ